VDKILGDRDSRIGHEPFFEEWKNVDLKLDDLSFANPFLWHENQNRTTKDRFPRRQLRSGKSFGLSILLDPGTNEYGCTNSDSVGFQV